MGRYCCFSPISAIFAENPLMKRLLVIGYVWPEPTSSAAGSRMMHLLKLFRGKNYEITFATTAAETDFMADLSEEGIKTAKIELNNESFDHFAAELDPQVVLFDRFMMEEQFGWRIDNACPSALKILDTEDLHFLRSARTEAWKKGISAEKLYLESDLAKREIASIYRCDLSLIISEAEMQLLKDQFHLAEDLLFYLPFQLEKISAERMESLPKFEERKNFISIGNFRHEPNWNAVLYLKQEIWPLIKKELPEAELHIYGSYASKKVSDLHNPKEGFLVKGRAEDALQVMQEARVCLAPIRFGAGLKGKLSDSMQAGTPSVTTSAGAEGMHGNLSWNGFIEDMPEAFATAAVKLYQEKDLWQECRQRGFNIINERFASGKESAGLLNRVKELEKNLPEHRRNNFIGSMLRHHQHRSTYFMARFIEEKNKKTAS